MSDSNDGVDRRPLEERIAAVRAQEKAGLLPTGDTRDWTCPVCGDCTNDPKEIMRHQGVHPPAES